MTKKNRKFICSEADNNVVRSIKALSEQLDSVPYLVVRKAIKRFLDEYENIESPPQEFTEYVNLKRLQYLAEEARIIASKQNGG